MLASGAAMLGAVVTTSASASELFSFEDLGTGSEVRSNILTADALSSFTSNTDIEFECGEGKCGEGKCGGKTDKKASKKEGKAEMKEEKSEKSAEMTEQKEEKKEEKAAPASAPAAAPAKKKAAAPATPK